MFYGFILLFAGSKRPIEHRDLCYRDSVSFCENVGRLCLLPSRCRDVAIARPTDRKGRARLKYYKLDHTDKIHEMWAKGAHFVDVAVSSAFRPMRMHPLYTGLYMRVRLVF